MIANDLTWSFLEKDERGEEAEAGKATGSHGACELLARRLGHLL